MSWDVQLLLWFNRTLACPFLDVCMVALTLAALPVVLLLALLPLLARHWREGIVLQAGLTLSTLMAVAVQFLLLRPRPVGVRLVLPEPAFPSFPSGHAAGVFACAALVALFWRRWAGPALLGAVLVSLSRVYLGRHYPSDVLGGAILGLGVALALYGLLYLSLGARGDPEPVSRTRPAWAWLLWGQLALVLLALLGAYLDLLDLAWLARPGLDKALHFLLFGGLGFLAVGWWARQPAGRVLAPLALLALSEELLQAFSSVRSLDCLDLAATLGGIVLLGWLGACLRA
ncbi:MAG: phosphatase PAP2 family protein [Chloroflexia bacterium]|nr:phosphatase PAP2 family protein [Chloroflexia bacterium]